MKKIYTNLSLVLGVIVFCAIAALVGFFALTLALISHALNHYHRRRNKHASYQG